MMRGFKLPWGLTGALLSTIYLHSIGVAASPTISVGLNAAFSSAPYLLELLETAADENLTSYFHLLDRVADGYFASASTDKDLYEKFLQVLEDDGHLVDPESLSTYQLALSMRSSAPRIEAHYQYYLTTAEPSLEVEQNTQCSIWVLFNSKQYCSPSLDEARGDVSSGSQLQELPFDRVFGKPSALPSILYADITSPSFGKFHKTLRNRAREGKISYRLRHRRFLDSESRPLSVPGYGVELALKRTDYIVIDDRDNSNTAPASPAKEVKFEDEELADLKPLSTSEVSSLSVKASSFIMQSDSPLDTLVKLTQDFPKYSSAIASHNATKEFLEEYRYNQAEHVPVGQNAIWMNGVQLINRKVEALEFLDMIRKERKLINGLRELGFSGPEAIQLLSHTDVANVKGSDGVQRFDWRDEIEGGNVIIWMNNIEKDKRYAEWPSTLTAMLQRTYPGQLPSVRRDTFNLIIPVDFTDPIDVSLVTETLLSFIRRRLAIRIGLVPITKTTHASEQARIVYHLIDTYGLQAAITYLEVSKKLNNLDAPSKLGFENATKNRKLKMEKTALPLTEVLKNDDQQVQVITASQNWIRRLAADSDVPPCFINGIIIPRHENWLQILSSRINIDLQYIQQAIFLKELESDDVWLPSLFLRQSAKRRNSLIVPEDEKNLKLFDVNKLFWEHQETLNVLPRIPADSSSVKADWAFMILVADFETEAGAKILATAAAFRHATPSTELLIVHNPSSAAESEISSDIFSYLRNNSYKPFSSINEFTSILTSEQTAITDDISEEARNYWTASGSLVKSLSLLPGQNAIFLNGRLVGHIPDTIEFDTEDLYNLLSYERAKRITPVYTAMLDLGIVDKIQDPLSFAKVSSIVAISTIADTPDGIFEQTSTLRMNEFDVWKKHYTAIEIGDPKSASIQLTALLDPATHQSQRWVPLLKVLSELEGVYLKLFLNPKDRLSELPIKRFYRYVLESKPTFDDNGAVQSLGALFNGVPQEALLTVSLDIPPAWLVAPKVSVHDLDNIKLSSIKTDVHALYELENILIEGHSREIPGGQPPRGSQLVLETERDPHAGDTIIMANLGYFQFKANPGYYNIKLQEGRSSEIFHIDSVGAQGWSPVPGDEKTEVVLMSFKGTTLYPRLSRNPGMEAEDVLEAKTNSKLDFVSQGLNFAKDLLGKGTLTTFSGEQAEINIFSVASGHLYERMMNIMMVSLMKHTKHTVKFWFIEQFLSPSFKDFIPFLAAEYGFKYEMVTYKWPHWLRGQSEKQREIWGYKILFLDVLFPLSLEKVIFVDADQIVRTDMIELVNHDLQGAPYGFTPMCDSRTEMEGFRFWKQGYWQKFLRGLPYHISALYVVDLHRFRQIAAGDRLRQQYHSLSADPGSLANLDQDLPNHMQAVLPIHSLPQEWLWCETWCSDEALKNAKTIDLCNNPLTKEPKLDRARRQVPEWTIYDDEIAAVDRKRKAERTRHKNVASRKLEEPEPTVTATSKKDEL